MAVICVSLHTSSNVEVVIVSRALAYDEKHIGFYKQVTNINKQRSWNRFTEHIAIWWSTWGCWCAAS